MALVEASLASALSTIFATLPDSPEEAANQLADAYADFASTGQFGSSAPQIVPAQSSALASTLLGAIGVPASGSPASFAAAWSTGVAAFWIAVPVAGPQTGATNGCPGAAALSASLSTVFANLANTPDTCASSLAAALYTATLSVTATVAPPPGTILPIL